MNCHALEDLVSDEDLDDRLRAVQVDLIHPSPQVRERVAIRHVIN